METEQLEALRQAEGLDKLERLLLDKYVEPVEEKNVYVHSGREPDEVRTFFEVPKEVVDRMYSPPCEGMTFVEIIEALLYENEHR